MYVIGWKTLSNVGCGREALPDDWKKSGVPLG